MPVPKRPLAPKTRERIRAGQRMFGEEFLTVYYGNESDGQGLDVPLRTVTAKDRFGLVRHDTLRMLSPRELARCMGFPDSYRLTGGRSEQVARIGNAVCPPVAEALVRGNVLVQQ
jgi:DNA (cytosine-5)-methyltransferase 1